MTKSEQLLSAFSEDYFFKELVIDDLHFTPEGASEVELADLLINLGDIIIAIQLKERNSDDQTNNSLLESKWLQKKCKVAKGQVKETLQFISSGNLPMFQNRRGQFIALQSDAEVIPLVVFENDQIDEYPHLLRKHSDTGMDINCMSLTDYREMCRVLITPVEIVEYLEYRKALYEEHGDIDFMIFDGEDDVLVTKPGKGESLVHHFLIEKYGRNETVKQHLFLQLFRNFLHQLQEHTVTTSTPDGVYYILLFLAHLDRYVISEFWDRLESTKCDAKKNVTGITRSLRSDIDEYTIVFVANGLLHMEDLLPIIRRKANPKQVLEVIVYWQDEDTFAIDFLYWDDRK